ncbi:MAG: phospholipase D-like domain-containing protein, partial [bacterium]
IFQAFEQELLDKLEIYYWPEANRPHDAQGRFGSLHIKGIVADQTHVFVSSANLTKYALELNLELGLLTEQPPLANQIITMINSMVRQRIFCPIEPKIVE